MVYHRPAGKSTKSPRRCHCGTCRGRIWALQADFKRHQKGERPVRFRCTYTGPDGHPCTHSPFASESTICAHLREKHLNDAVLPCFFCEERFPSATRRLSHMWKDHRDYLWRCSYPDCKYQGGRKIVDIEKHVALHFENREAEWPSREDLARFVCQPLKRLTTEQETFFSEKREAVEAVDISYFYEEIEIDVEPVEEAQPMQPYNYPAFDSSPSASTVLNSPTPEASTSSSLYSSPIFRSTSLREDHTFQMEAPRRPTVSQNGSAYVSSSLANSAHTTFAPEVASELPQGEHDQFARELGRIPTEAEFRALLPELYEVESPGSSSSTQHHIGEYHQGTATPLLNTTERHRIPLSSYFKLVLPTSAPSPRRQVAPPQSTSWLRSHPSARPPAQQPTSDTSARPLSQQSYPERSLSTDPALYGRLERATARTWCEMIIQDLLSPNSSPAVLALSHETFLFLHSLGEGSGPLAPWEREQFEAVTQDWDITFTDGPDGEGNWKWPYTLDLPNTPLN